MRRCSPRVNSCHDGRVRLRLPAGYHADAAIDVKRSRFIATIARVEDEDAARAVIAEVRRAHQTARHHCSAFIVEVPGGRPIERSSDDGEPAGTAGMPMLDVLRGAGLTQVVAVVTRYFGGVLLGTGGLVRAYSDAVQTALDAAPRVQVIERSAFSIVVEHEHFGRVQAQLLRAGIDIVDVDYSAVVQLTVLAGCSADVESVVSEVSRCASRALARGACAREHAVD